MSNLEKKNEISMNTSTAANNNNNNNDASVNNKQKNNKPSAINYKRILNAFVVVIVFLFGSLAKPQ
jgi:hypothetical protein